MKRHTFFGWCLLISLLCSGQAIASGKTPEPLQQLRLSLVGSLGDFYLLYGVDLDPAYVLSVNRHLTAGDLQLQHLDSGARQILQPPWQAYRLLLDEMSLTLQQGLHLEGHAIVELLRLNDQLLQLCNQLQPTPPQPTQSSQLALQLQQLATAYIAHSVGANVLGGNAPAIDEQSRAFAHNLAQLTQQTEQGSEQHQLLLAIQRKWRFIETALLNYQSDTVPSLVQRYTVSMIAQLGQIKETPPR
jgi:hypothetical protein